ncbi:hypothetical protein H072_6677 [Dactylellina haptotyla CBS 200.50]|uniref:F-box domain-containing protein n=1 Tax=Dactylellina haptotyla (strain CBS 200.50) TaxID=1284197 RepID=S8BJI5_DACHA|nr:hypothetical protein H072_6677 [Dactylellina haptotyla CBS 200.50]
MFYSCQRQLSTKSKSPLRNVFHENVVHSKIVCLEKDQALLWPQYSVQTTTTTPQRRVVEELVQYLLNPEDSAVLVEPVPTRRQNEDAPYKACLTTMPTEIHFMISEYLSDYDALCLSLTNRALFNKSIDRMQRLVCKPDTIGCWAGKALVRSNPNNPTPAATAVEAQYLDKATDATFVAPALRSNETLYLASFPDKRLVLHGIAHDLSIPQVIRRFVSAVLRDKEYENLFKVREEYVLRNLDRKEYVKFNTGKIQSTVVSTGDFQDAKASGPAEILHDAEILMDAIACAAEGTFSPEKFEKGSWAGCRLDIVLKKRVQTEQGWKEGKKSAVTRAYIKPEDIRGRLAQAGTFKERNCSLKRDKSVGRKNRMYSFLGKEKFVLPAQPRLSAEGRIIWAS